jgi:hypothetical protein
MENSTFLCDAIYRGREGRQMSRTRVRDFFGFLDYGDVTTVWTTPGRYTNDRDASQAQSCIQRSVTG